MKTIKTDGISSIGPVPGAAGEWYFGLDDGQGDLYEAEELYHDGRLVKGRKLCLVHYPDGQVFFPVPKLEGHYSERPVFFEGGIFILDVDFPKGSIRIIRFANPHHFVQEFKVNAFSPLVSVNMFWILAVFVDDVFVYGRRSCIHLDRIDVWIIVNNFINILIKCLFEYFFFIFRCRSFISTMWT